VRKQAPSAPVRGSPETHRWITAFPSPTTGGAITPHHDNVPARRAQRDPARRSGSRSRHADSRCAHETPPTRGGESKKYPSDPINSCDEAPTCTAAHRLLDCPSSFLCASPQELRTTDTNPAWALAWSRRWWQFGAEDGQPGQVGRVDQVCPRAARWFDRSALNGRLGANVSVRTSKGPTPPPLTVLRVGSAAAPPHHVHEARGELNQDSVSNAHGALSGAVRPGPSPASCPCHAVPAIRSRCSVGTPTGTRKGNSRTPHREQPPLTPTDASTANTMPGTRQPPAHRAVVHCAILLNKPRSPAFPRPRSPAHSPAHLSQIVTSLRQFGADLRVAPRAAIMRCPFRPFSASPSKRRIHMSTFTRVAGAHQRSAGLDGSEKNRHGRMPRRHITKPHDHHP
jgi:hypothetical protein